MALLKNRFPAARIHMRGAGTLSSSLNEQLLFAEREKYDIFFRVDGDDLCLTERFDKQLNFIKQNPGYAVYSAGLKYVYRDGSSLDVQPSSKHPKLLEHYVNTAVMHATAGFALRTLKETVGKVDVYQHSHSSEDKLLWQDRRLSVCRQRDILSHYHIFGDFRSKLAYRLRALRLDLRFSFRQKVWLIAPLVLLSFAIFIYAALVRDLKTHHRLRALLLGRRRGESTTGRAITIG